MTDAAADAATGGGWTAWSAARAESIRRVGQWREVRAFDARGPEGTVDVEGSTRQVVSFAANDYLGLSQHPAVIAAAAEALEQWGAGAGAARLITGSRPIHHQLEAELASWKGTERALLFPTGYMANLGVLAGLAETGVTIVSDELNHASIVDGCRLARGEVAVFHHHDLDHAGALVAAAPGRVVVVSDTVFSMDGDQADVDGLVELCARAGALLVLDEAHAVLGPEPALDAAPSGHPVLRVGTLSKTLGSVGGFVAGPAAYVDLLVNRARPFIFTTASPPADAAAALAALRVLRSLEGAARRDRLRQLVDRVRPGHGSPIIPIVLGAEDAALAAAQALLDRGLLVPAIRPPTVAVGSCRLRVTLSAAHEDRHVDALVAGLDALGLMTPAAEPVPGEDQVGAA